MVTAETTVMAGVAGVAGCSLGLGLRPLFSLDLIGNKLDPLGPAGAAGPEQRAVAQLADNLGQGVI